jgi:hypothetical protein
MEMRASIMKKIGLLLFIGALIASMGLGNAAYAADTLAYGVSSGNITASPDYAASFAIIIPIPEESYCGIQFAVSLPSGASIDGVKYSLPLGTPIAPQQEQEFSGIWYFAIMSEENIFDEELVCTVSMTYTAKSPGVIAIEEIKRIRRLDRAKLQESIGGATDIAINPYGNPASSCMIAVGASPQTGGTVSGGGEYGVGAEVVLAAAPSDNYKFAGWFEDGASVSSANPLIFQAASNRTVIARFEYIGEGAPGAGAELGAYAGGGQSGAAGISPDAEGADISEEAMAGGPAKASSAETPKFLLGGSGASGYVSGYPDGTFRADGSLTRYEAAVMFYNLILDIGKASYESEVSRLSDVGVGQWHSKAVGCLMAAGALTGYPDGTFKGGNTISRAEFAAIASRFGELELGGDIPFTDVAAGHWAYDYIKSAYSNGWIAGYPDGAFGPDRKVTRAETVVIINRMLAWDSASVQGENRFADIVGDEWYCNDVLLASNGA